MYKINGSIVEFIFKVFGKKSNIYNINVLSILNTVSIFLKIINTLFLSLTLTMFSTCRQCNYS